MLSVWQFESRAYLYFDILKSFLTLLCFSDLFFQHKAFLKAILYLGDLAVLSLFLMAWQWQPAIQLTFFRFLCRGSHRVLPREQRLFVSIFRRAPSRRVAISLLACLAVDNRVTCCLCCVSCSLLRACLHGVGDPGLVGLVSFVFTLWRTQNKRNLAH